MAVVATVELHDAGAAGHGPREAERMEGGLGAARGEPDHLGRRHERADPLGELDRAAMGREVVAAVRHRASDGLHDQRVTVPEDERAASEDEVGRSGGRRRR